MSHEILPSALPQPSWQYPAGNITLAPTMVNRTFRTLTILALLFSAARCEATLTFNFTDGLGLTALQGTDPIQAQNFRDGFAAAGQLWSDRFNDNITINIEMDSAALPAGVLGSASSSAFFIPYNFVSAALANDMSSADDFSAVANLQPGMAIDFVTNEPTDAPPSPALRTLDNNNSTNNTTLRVNVANARALGLTSGTSSVLDARITFSSNFSFDFNSSNGLSGFDFVGVAAHELGHAMGFVSGVDSVDATSGSGPNAPLDQDDATIFSVLDLFRYSADSLAASGQPANGAVLDLAAGGTGAEAPFLSFDAGATSVGLLSNGRFNGNQQASHWLDNLGLGIMDPTFFNGELGVVSTLDVRAFDAIGYDLTAIPEPSAVLFGGLVCCVLGIKRAGKRMILQS